MERKFAQEVQETLTVFKILYNLNFSKALPDSKMKPKCATLNKCLSSFTLCPVINI